jgi:tRNA threonylcarbamoyladenosine biosynthesis protein TsaE
MKIIEIPSQKNISRAAREFIEIMGKTTVFAFYGGMGAGKTTFIKAICRELKVSNNVSSPSFALINEYISPIAGVIYHLDLYRIKSADELFDLGYEDYFYSGELCFVEWPEKAEHLLPPDTKKILINVNSDGSRTVKAGD